MQANDVSSCPQLSFTDDRIDQTIYNIRSSIANTIFKTKSNIVMSLLDSVKYISNDKYNLKLSIIDSFSYRRDIPYIRSTLPETYTSLLSSSDISLVSYTDDKIITYIPTITIPNMAIRQFVNSRRYQKELIIYNVNSFLPSYQEMKTVNNVYINNTNYQHVTPNQSIIYTPINISLSKIDCVDQTTIDLPIGHIRRYQNAIYRFKSPSLSSWKIIKTVMFISLDENDRKFTTPLHVDNVEKPTIFDALSISFEYTGSFDDIDTNLFHLIEYIYKDYATFSVEYSLLSEMLNTKLTTYFTPTTIISKQYIAYRDMNDFVFAQRVDGERVIIIIYQQNVYELTNNDFNIISMSKPLQLSSLSSLVLSYQTSSRRQYKLHDSNKPSIIVFDCIRHIDPSTQCKQYYVYDLFNFDIYNVRDISYLTKIDIIAEILPTITNFIDEERKITLSLLPLVMNDTTKQLMDKHFPLSHGSIHYHISSINTISELLPNQCKPYNGLFARSINPLSDIERTNILFIRESKHNTIKFNTIWDSDKEIFLLYTIGNIHDVVKHHVLYNKYNLKHFGASLLTNTKADNRPLLFTNPYYNHICQTNKFTCYSYAYIPSSDAKSALLSDIIANNKANTNDSHTLPPHIDITYNYNGNVDLSIDMKQHPMKYHNTTIEFALHKVYGWVPINMSTESPDTYLHALHIMSTIFEDISENDKMSTIGVNTTVPIQLRSKQHQSLLTLTSSLTELITKYILERFMTETDLNMIDIIDIESVNGDIIQSISHVNNICVMSNLTELLTNYVYSLSNKSPKRNLFNQMNVFATKIDSIAVNVNIILNNEHNRRKGDFSLVCDTINQSNEHKINSIDTIFVQSADEVFANILSLLSFIDMARKVLKAKGMIIVKRYDKNEVKHTISSIAKSSQMNAQNVKMVDISKSINKRINYEDICDTIDDEYDTSMMQQIMSSFACATYHDAINMAAHSNPEMAKKIMTMNDDMIDLQTVKILKVENNEMELLCHSVSKNGYTRDNKLTVTLPSWVDLTKYNTHYQFVDGWMKGYMNDEGLLTRMERHNLQLLLGLKEEMHTTIFRKQYEEAYLLQGSFEYIDGYNDTDAYEGYELNSNVLLEREVLTEGEFRFIADRLIDLCKHCVLIVTTNNVIDEMEEYIDNNESVQTVVGDGLLEYLITIMKAEHYNVYMIYPDWMYDEDENVVEMKRIVARMIRDCFGRTEPLMEHFEYETVANNYEGTIKVTHPLIENEMIDVMKQWFNLEETVKPMKEFELTKYISMNMSFTNIKTVEATMKCMTFDKWRLKEEE